jgi:hypothetical protein
MEILMRKQDVKQVFENSSMEVALEAPGKSIARGTDKGDQLVTAIPGLSLYRRDEPTQPMMHVEYIRFPLLEFQ